MDRPRKQEAQLSGQPDEEASANAHNSYEGTKNMSFAALGWVRYADEEEEETDQEKDSPKVP